jgi:hypothetical protein
MRASGLALFLPVMVLTSVGAACSPSQPRLPAPFTVMRAVPDGVPPQPQDRGVWLQNHAVSTTTGPEIDIGAAGVADSELLERESKTTAQGEMPADGPATLRFMDGVWYGTDFNGNDRSMDSLPDGFKLASKGVGDGLLLGRPIFRLEHTERGRLTCREWHVETSRNAASEPLNHSRIFVHREAVGGGRIETTQWHLHTTNDRGPLVMSMSGPWIWVTPRSCSGGHCVGPATGRCASTHAVVGAETDALIVFRVLDRAPDAYDSRYGERWYLTREVCENVALRRARDPANSELVQSAGIHHGCGRIR